MEKMPTFDELMNDCKEKQKPDEEICYAFGIGRMFPKIGMMKAMKKGMDLIKEQEGFIGVHPIDLWHNLLIFDTVNHAKVAMNNLKAKGIKTGQIAPLLVQKIFLEREEKN